MNSKAITVRLTDKMLKNFKRRCKQTGLSMSEFIRLHVKDFSENGPSGPLAAYLEITKK